MQQCCPICANPLEDSDKNFFACSCNYQVCSFCVHQLVSQYNSKCPGCRSTYKEENFRIKVDEADFENSSCSGTASTELALSEVEINELSKIRFVSKRIVYVMGISKKIASPALLRSDSYFGQYGTIKRLVVGRGGKSSTKETLQYKSTLAYITYDAEEEASLAIKAVNGLWFDKIMIKASYGNTRYCNKFLQGLTCPWMNSTCNFLHELDTHERSSKIEKKYFPCIPATVPKTAPPVDAFSWGRFPPCGWDATWNGDSEVMMEDRGEVKSNEYEELVSWTGKTSNSIVEVQFKKDETKVKKSSRDDLEEEVSRMLSSLKAIAPQANINCSQDESIFQKDIGFELGLSRESKAFLNGSTHRKSRKKNNRNFKAFNSEDLCESIPNVLERTNSMIGGPSRGSNVLGHSFKRHQSLTEDCVDADFPNDLSFLQVGSNS